MDLRMIIAIGYSTMLSPIILIRSFTIRDSRIWGSFDYSWSSEIKEDISLLAKPLHRLVTLLKDDSNSCSRI